MIKIINKTVKKFIFWLNCARVYSLPITVLNWFVIFIYSIKHGGNPILGLIAVVGIGFVHMATNLIDDYFDYKILEKELKAAIMTFLAISAAIGAVLFFTSGIYVALLAFLGLIMAITYQKFSLKGLGEIAVIITFGPLLYEGVYYVMTSKFSPEVLILSLACALFTNTILYAHMLMDFDGDECSHKTTLCRNLKTKESALDFILVFYISSYIMILYLAIKSHNYLYLLTYLTTPLIIDLYLSLKNFNNDKTNIPKIYPWHYPLDNWNKIKTTTDAPFYFRFFYSRNIVTTFMLLACLAIIFG